MSQRSPGRGVAVDYSPHDESTLQRDMARVERSYRSKGFFDVHARVGHVFQTKENHVRVEIVVAEGPATLNRNVTVVALHGLPKPVADATLSAARSALPPRRRFDEEARLRPGGRGPDRARHLKSSTSDGKSAIEPS
ncbi:MAG: hypothetical protein ABSC94_24895 [Polyangiaceae bacterium]|jgi:hypothetical protein